MNITTNHSRYKLIFIVSGRGTHSYPKRFFTEETALNDLKLYLNGMKW